MANPPFDSKSIPGPDAISKASELYVLDVKGDKVRFGSLFESQKAVVVFIRHFFCGSCQDYVAQLASVRKESLDEAGIDIIVIGCGEWNPIQMYAETTDFHGPIYADPTRALYRVLGMTRETLAVTPNRQEKPSYLVTGRFANTFRSIWRGPLKNPALVGKQGNISQLGGDFVFGPGQQCSFASRMENTEDHAEVSSLMQHVGVTYP